MSGEPWSVEVADKRERIFVLKDATPSKNQRRKGGAPQKKTKSKSLYGARGVRPAATAYESLLS
jgi:hypothetical protein